MASCALTQIALGDKIFLKKSIHRVLRTDEHEYKKGPWIMAPIEDELIDQNDLKS